VSARLQRIAIERIELALDAMPSSRAELLAARLEGALAASLDAADSARLADAIAARLLAALGEHAAWR
jgi:hypothetical protein